MTTSPPLTTTPITDDGQLTQRWADLLLDPGPGQSPTLWLGWVRPDGTMLPLLVPVGELPRRPGWRSLQGVRTVHAEVARLHRVDPDDLHLTLALERPGPAGPTDDDLEWSEAVEEQLAEALEAGCSFHVVDAHRVVQLLPRSWWPR